MYAIAKNEAAFVDRFMDAMSEADWVCVLDTGSTDGTAEQLRARGAIVEQKVIDPWRFDTARNESMKLIPAEADICCCVDLDEQFRSGWRAALEAAWQPDTTRARYRYTWSFNPDGSEGCVFWPEKIHKNGVYHWTHPVHEVLEYVGEGNDLYHAWNMFYTEESGWVAVEFAVNEDDWNRMDLTFSANGSDSEYIGDGSNYLDVYQF